MRHHQLAFESPIFIKCHICLQFRVELTVVKMLLLQQLSLSVNQIMSSSDGFLTSMLHIATGLCLSTLISADLELFPLFGLLFEVVELAIRG